jgi:1-acyl-sn-glycerol-3-phosphate acyltransferase
MMQRRRSLTCRERIRSACAVLVFFFALIAVTPLVLFLVVTSWGRATSYVVERIAPPIAILVFRTAGIRFHIRQHGDTQSGPAVFIFNHSSTVDVLSVLALGLPRARFVVKWEMQYNPIFLILGRVTGQVFVRRERSEKAVETLQRAYSRIRRNGLSLVMAPEGTRKHPGAIGPFKKGPFRTAMDMGYPVVPIWFEGNWELASRGSLQVRPGDCVAHIHPPIDTSSWTLDELDEHIAAVRAMYLEWEGVTDEAEGATSSPQSHAAGPRREPRP